MAGTKLQIIFYSLYGHTYRMTEALAEGAKTVTGTDVELFRVPELFPEDILEKSGAKAAQKAFAHIPILKTDYMTEADAYLFATPTRFGNICAQMRNFLNQLDSLWQKDTFAGKVGSVFTCAATAQDGQAAITRLHATLFHLGMIVVGTPYGENRSATPYSASTLSGGEGQRMLTENELMMARFQGQMVAEISRDIKRGRSLLS